MQALWDDAWCYWMHGPWHDRYLHCHKADCRRRQRDEGAFEQRQNWEA